MLPSVSAKLDKNLTTKTKSKKAKKEKKSKKSKTEKKKKKKRSKSSSNDSSSEEELLTKRKKRHYSTDSDEWIEKDSVSKKSYILECSESENAVDTKVTTESKSVSLRDDWMSGILIPTFSKNQPTDKKSVDRKDIDSYDPKNSSRELNPFWKNGGTGLPSLEKSKNDSDNEESTSKRDYFKMQTPSRGSDDRLKSKYHSSSNFRKPRNNSDDDDEPSKSRSCDKFRKPKNDSDNETPSKYRSSVNFRRPRHDSDEDEPTKSRSFDNYRKPRNDSDDVAPSKYRSSDNFRKSRNDTVDERSKYQNTSRGNWRKKEDICAKGSKETERHNQETKQSSHKILSKSPVESNRRNSSPSSSSSDEASPANDDALNRSSMNDFLTDAQMNEYGAKIIKAEIMGQDQLVQELKDKLDRARKYRETHKTKLLSKGSQSTSREEKEDVLLTSTNSHGFSRPLQRSITKPSDPWGGKSKKKSNKKVETHMAGERVRYFADDDKYDIKQMVTIFNFTFTLVLDI